MTQLDSISLAIGRVPNVLSIVTVAEPGNWQTGFLASLVGQVSLNPPRLSLAVGKGRAAYELLKKHPFLVMHILEEGQKQFVGHFGKGFQPGEESFAGLEIHHNVRQIPVIEGIWTRMHCKVMKTVDVESDHDVLILDVESADFPATEVLPKPWVHLRKNGRGY